MDLSTLLLVLFSVESMPLEWALVRVGLVIAPTIRASEWMRTWVALLSLETWRVHLLIRFAVPPKFSVVFRFVWTIALNALGALDSAREDCMSPLSAVFALGYTQVYVCPFNSRDISANVKTPINKALSFASALLIPNVNLDNWHVWLGWYFDNPWSRSKFDIIEYLILFQDIFDITCIKTILSFAVWK